MPASLGNVKSESKWITWNGGDMPVDGRTIVELLLRDGAKVVTQAGNCFWYHTAECDDIVEYRVVEEAQSQDYRYDEKDVPDFNGLFPKLDRHFSEPPPQRQETEAILNSCYKWWKQEKEKFDNKYLRNYPYDTIDIYRVLEVYEVTDPCIQHAVKKLLCAGKRGYKEVEKDVQEAIQSLQRWEEMRREESL